MKALWIITVLLIIVFLVLNVHTQPPPDYEDDEDDEELNFVEPRHLEDDADSFIRNGKEYIFLNEKMPFHVAELICRDSYRAHLTIIKDLELPTFLAEAFAETNLVMDALWIGAKKDYGSSKWNWVREDTKEPVDKDLVNEFVYNIKVNASDRLCLTFARKNHDIPQFQPITCRAHRPPICERLYDGGDESNSTHPGWIKLGNRYYKIFNERVDWDTAVGKCFLHDHDATLAVVNSTKRVRQLGRYLLIGRPSLENAWLDGRFINGNYRFEQEKIVLANVTDETGFPPWRYGKISKKDGCVLLDRHLKNITIFVEARCERFRPYICYKLGKPDEHEVIDVIVGKYGYRLHYSKKTWLGALTYCRDHYRNYFGYLAEVRQRVQNYHLLYVMGENRTAVRHIWLGGKYHENEKVAVWRWNTDGSVIATGRNSVLHWVVNTTYTPEIEENNICLKMDRENHIVDFTYGASCFSEQSFICSFTADNLRRLQNDEMNSPNEIHDVD